MKSSLERGVCARLSYHKEKGSGDKKIAQYRRDAYMVRLTTLYHICLIAEAHCLIRRNKNHYKIT